MNNVLIIGHGEVGKSIERLYSNEQYNIYTMDKEKKDLPEGKNTKIDIMHICYPYIDEKFVNYVIDNMNNYSPELTIINSTVPSGTTKIIWENIYEEENMQRHLVHSPLMGVHPNLTESMKIGVKIVGGCTEEATELACKHFERLGIDTYAYNNSDESEIAKMLSTTYYSLCIRFMQEVHRECEKNNLDFDNVYNVTNEIYNSLYSQMNMDYVKRPILKYMGKGLGGHCCHENAVLLKKQNTLNKITDLIIEEGKPDANI